VEIKWKWRQQIPPLVLRTYVPNHTASHPINSNVYSQCHENLKSHMKS
jgi:hypothetical protein